MRYVLFQESLKGQRKWVIRRWKEGKYQRLPVEKYASIREDQTKLEEFVKRLNAPLDAKFKVEFKHAFISPALLEDYLTFLVAQIPSQSGAKQEFSYLKRYVLNYFIGKLDLMNPLDWHKIHETKWAAYLLSKQAPKAAKTKRDIVISINRFIGWLHKQRPEEVPALEFKPLSRAKLKSVEAGRKLRKEIRTRGAIPDKDWNVIIRGAPLELQPFINLSYYFGLRRAEALGVMPGDVKKGYLELQRQLAALGRYEPLKGREEHRKIPHWFTSAATAYGWVEGAQKHLMNPSTLTHKWNKLMVKLDMHWDFHDLRHSFITKAIRAYPAKDVQLAAGHKDIRTTMGYSHDDRDLSGEVFTPEAS